MVVVVVALALFRTVGDIIAHAFDHVFTEEVFAIIAANETTHDTLLSAIPITFGLSEVDQNTVLIKFTSARDYLIHKAVIDRDQLSLHLYIVAETSACPRLFLHLVEYLVHRRLAIVIIVAISHLLIILVYMS